VTNSDENGKNREASERIGRNKTVLGHTGEPESSSVAEPSSSGDEAASAQDGGRSSRGASHKETKLAVGPGSSGSGGEHSAEPATQAGGGQAGGGQAGGGSAGAASTPIIWDEDEHEHEDPLLDTVVAERYRIKRRVGEGGMGVVYEAEHVMLEKRMALKVLSPELSHKKDLVKRFLREAQAASRIGHENIVDITDFGSTPSGTVFFAMEFLEGKDLATVIEEESPLPWSRAKSIVIQICRALGAAHAKGIIHRDLKPENIFLIKRAGRPDFVKVVDFGIAKVTGADEGGRRLTKTGMIFGTPDYMSPEQASGKKPDHRIDIYALGVILYEMVTGKVPFTADSFMGILTKHMFEAPAPPSEACPSGATARQIDELILKAMSKERDDRFQSMSAFAAALQQAALPAREETDGGEDEISRESDIVLLTSPKEGSAVSDGSAEGPVADEGLDGGDGGGESTDVVSLEDHLPVKRRSWGLVVGGIIMVGAIAAGAAVLLNMGGSSDPSNGTKEGRDRDIATRIHKAPDGDIATSGHADAGKEAGGRGVGPTAATSTDGAVARPTRGSRPSRGTRPDVRPPGVVKLTVRTTPPGASVYLGGKLLGKTPLDRYEVRFDESEQRLLIKRARYRTVSLPLIADRDRKISRRLKRRRARRDPDRRDRGRAPDRDRGRGRTSRGMTRPRDQMSREGLGELKDPF
jgi:serine/threonine protein kinase